jgi:hypothetical protein
MKTIIAGCRNFHDLNILYDAIEYSKFIITEVVSGGAKGVDELGEIYAQTNNIPLKIINAQWNLYGKRAGMIRNVAMADESEALIVLWDYQSKGTGGMIKAATARNLKVFVCDIRGR